MGAELGVEASGVGLGDVTAPMAGNFSNALKNTRPTCVKCMALPTCFFMLFAERAAGAVRHLENMQCVPALLTCSSVIGNPLMDKTSVAATSVVA